MALNSSELVKLRKLKQEIGYENAMIAFFNSDKITFEELTENFDWLPDLIKHSDGKLRTRLVDEYVRQAGSDTKRLFKLYSITLDKPNILSPLTKQMALNRCLASADTLKKASHLMGHLTFGFTRKTEAFIRIGKMALAKSLNMASSWTELMSIYCCESDSPIYSKILAKMRKVATTFSEFKWLYEQHSGGCVQLLRRCLDFQLDKEQLLWVFEQAKKLNNTKIKNKVATRLAQLK